MTGPEWLDGEMLTVTPCAAVGVQPTMGRWFTGRRTRRRRAR